MSCSPFDLRDYLLGELAPPDRHLLEKHVERAAAAANWMVRVFSPCGRWPRKKSRSASLSFPVVFEPRHGGGRAGVLELFGT
jgi:hypothetical protein